MHGRIGLPADHRGLDFLHEHPLAAEAVERDIEPTVAHGLDHDQRSGHPRPAKQLRHPMGLPQGEWRAPGGQPEHPRSGHHRHRPGTR